jgi:hypothetical protein
VVPVGVRAVVVLRGHAASVPPRTACGTCALGGRPVDYGHARSPARRGEGSTTVSTPADHAGARGLAERLGIEPGQVVQVVGADVPDDVDTALLDDIAARTGTDLI